VNLLDLAIALVAIAAAVGGWRLGLLARVLAWLGVAVGLAFAVPLVAPVVARVGGGDPDTRVTVALVFLVLCGAVGQAIGLWASFGVERRRPKRTLSLAERGGGAALGAVGVFVVVWMLLPSLSVAAGWPNRAARASLIVELMDALAPEPPDAFAAWGREVADAAYPAALDPLTEPPDPGIPPETALDAATLEQVQPSIVHVTGVACSTVQDGSGVAMGPGIIVTNAHVVAGESQTHVVLQDGTELESRVIAFDPVRDLAILRVGGLDAPALSLGDAEVGDVGAILGFPGGGEMQIAPARVGESISARGTDIYRRGTSIREVLVLAARLEPGDSGAPLIGVDGTVLGIAFAVDPGSATTAYALARSEIEAMLELSGGQAVEPTEVGTGPCLDP